MMIKVWTLTVDTDKGIRTTTHRDETEAVEALVDNFLDGEEFGHDPVAYATEKMGLVLYIDEHEVPVTVEIIHGRDPDSSCDHTVFVNGEPTTDYNLVDLDPGRGWEREDWESFKESELRSGTPAFREALEREFESYGDSKYIEDER